MVNQRTKIIFAAPTFASPIQIAIFEQLKKILNPDEITMRSVTDEAEVQKERLMQALHQTKPTGLIVMDVRADADIIHEYYSAGVPIVIIDEVAEGTSSIMTDNLAGGRIAGEYLASLGRKKIAIVSGRKKVKGGFNAEQRFKGFQQALNAKGLSIPMGCAIEVQHYSREDGTEAMPKLMGLNVDAIFCAAGDSCALGLLGSGRDRGARIPEDIAIVGFDDLLIAQLSTPSLTTVRQPLSEIVNAAYKLVVTDRDQTLKRHQNILFKPELVKRQSA